MERPDLKCSTGAVRDDRCCLWCYLTAHVYDNIAPKPGCALDWLHGEILRHRRIEPGSRPAN